MPDVPQQRFPWWTLILPLLPTAGMLIGQWLRSGDFVLGAILYGSPLCGFAAGARLSRVPGRSVAGRILALVLIGVGLTVASGALAIGGCCATNDPANVFSVR